MPTCRAIKTNDEICGRDCFRDETLCSLHNTTRLRDIRKFEINQMKLNHKILLRTVQQEYVRENPFRRNDAELHRILTRIRRENHHRLVALNERLDAELGRPPPPPPVRQVERLEQIARDNQNVHTREAVAMVKKTVDILLKIPVPFEYRWNSLVISKTPAEILLENRLKKQTAISMLNHYISGNNIYDMGDGIYSKVLDAIWQFIKHSPDKNELNKILVSELNDNVNTCHQGNLTRLCNVLCGYLEGIEVVGRSKAEILGDALPKLLKISNETERLRRARDILKENGVNPDEWDAWLEPLME